MPPNYLVYEQAASKAVDLVLGELLRFTPMKSDNYASAADTDRGAAFTCPGTFLEGRTKIGFSEGDRRQSDFTTRTNDQTAVASVDTVNIPQGLALQAGDMIETVDQVEVRKFTIVAINIDSVRLDFSLVPKR